MIKALREIGAKKVMKFATLSLLLPFYKVLIFPPLRTLFLRCLGATIGKNVILHHVNFFNVYRRGFKGLIIGNNCFIGDETLIDLADDVVLMDNVTIAERVCILTHTNVGYRDHPLRSYFPAFNKPVLFREGCFVGANVTVLPGVVVGSMALISAGSVVTHAVAAKEVVAGVPAKTLKVLS